MTALVRRGAQSDRAAEYRPRRDASKSPAEDQHALAAQAKQAHTGIMTTKPTRPMFKQMPFKDGSGWRVEVQWPSGSTQHVDDFQTDDEARDWISNRSTAWLLKHPPPA